MYLAPGLPVSVGEVVARQNRDDARVPWLHMHRPVETAYVRKRKKSTKIAVLFQLTDAATIKNWRLVVCARRSSPPLRINCEAQRQRQTVMLPRVGVCFGKKEAMGEQGNRGKH